MTDLAPSRKEREYKRRREEILGAALSVFAERGYYGTTMAQISQQSEYPLGTIYKYFTGKEQIFHDMVMDRGIRLGRLIAEAASRKELSPKERAYACLMANAQFLRNNQAFVRVYISLRSSVDMILAPDLNADINRMHDRMVAVYTEIFQEGVDKGEFRPYPAEDLSSLFYGVIFSAIWPWVSGSRETYDIESWLNRSFELLTKGFCVSE
ncbi:TetR/AcrR family transcriptional regulator [Desulfoluna sp.]|uniref:TetR/AcrR family transcriptional regulator n=1 Tax=Desulfoluna sp. TaxID=2045199 RepID=UPI00262D2C7B|nr:TetR/AcrR family transcriptional regulator [Desulfoluna sp.]